MHATSNGNGMMHANGHSNGSGALSTPWKKTMTTILYTNDDDTHLPLAVWRKILNYRIADSKSWIVPARLMIVCKAWQSIVWSVIKKIDFTIMSAGYLNVIVRNAYAVTSFLMDKGDDLSVPFVLSSLPALKSLELLHCEHLTDIGTRKLVKLKGKLYF